MSQLIYRCEPGVNDYPHRCLKHFGKISAPISHEQALDGLRQGDRRVELDADLEERAALLVRKLIEDECIQVIWTDSEPIELLLSTPEPEVANLTWCVKRFKENNPGHWEDPLFARGACHPVSCDFFRLLCEKGVVTQHQIDTGVAEVRSRPYGGDWHFDVRVGRIVIDWTARQHDPDCSVPHIYVEPSGKRLIRPLP